MQFAARRNRDGDLAFHALSWSGISIACLPARVSLDHAHRRPRPAPQHRDHHHRNQKPSSSCSLLWLPSSPDLQARPSPACNPETATSSGFRASNWTTVGRYVPRSATNTTGFPSRVKTALVGMLMAWESGRSRYPCRHSFPDAAADRDSGAPHRRESCASADNPLLSSASGEIWVIFA